MLDLPALAEKLTGRMVYFEADGGRICVLSNFMGHVLLGSTDIPVDDPDGVICDDGEVDYLLGAFARLFPKVPVDRSNIFFSYAGVRPLQANNATDPGAISRDHLISTLPPNRERRFPILSLIGGKWTTGRALSAQAADEVLQHLGKRRSRPTEDLAIGGGVSLSQAAAPTEALLSSIVKDFGISRARAHQLVARYGCRARLVAASLSGDETFLSSLPECSRQEIAYICDIEMVEHVEDFLFGRTSLFLQRPLDYVALMELTETVADIRGWDSARKSTELQRLIDRYRSLHRIDVPPQRGKKPQFL